MGVYHENINTINNKLDETKYLKILCEQKSDIILKLNLVLAGTNLWISRT